MCFCTLKKINEITKAEIIVFFYIKSPIKSYNMGQIFTKPIPGSCVVP